MLDQGRTHDNRGDLVEVLDLMAAGKVTPRIETYPLAQVNTVRDRVEAGTVRYRAIVELD